MVLQKQLLPSFKSRILTGERPTGPLHVGHYFGTIQNRVRLQDQGHECCIVIADYQVFTDRLVSQNIGQHVKDLLLDYLSCGLDPFHSDKKTHIFVHSAVAALHQLMVPFLGLVSKAELERNPTVKAEMQSAQLKNMNGNMLTYPVHQAADILSGKGELVPVGEDQLPHLELTRTIASRFNDRFGVTFKLPEPLLSSAKRMIGLDGNAKMSKSLGNALFIKSSPEEIVKLIKAAKTDKERHITFDEQNRPEISNLLTLLSLSTDKTTVQWADQIGDKGAGALKKELSDALIAFFHPIREKRKALEKESGFLNQVLNQGNLAVSAIADTTLQEVKKIMRTQYHFF